MKREKCPFKAHLPSMYIYINIVWTHSFKDRALWAKMPNDLNLTEKL